MKDGGNLFAMLKLAYRGLWLRYGFVILLILVGVALSVVDPIIFGRIFDVIIDGLDQPTGLLQAASSLLLLWAIVTLLNILVGIASKYLLWHTCNTASYRYSTIAMHDLLGWSRERFSRVKTGRLIKIVDDAWSAVFLYPQMLLEDLVPTALTFIVVLIVGFILDWRLALSSVLVVPIGVGMGLYAWKKAMPAQEKLSQKWTGLSSTLEETVANISLIQNSAQESQRERLFIRQTKDVRSRQLRLDLFWSIFHGGGGSLSMVGRFIVFIVGIWLVMHDQTSVGTFVTFLGMTSYLLAPVQYTIANNLPRVIKQKAALQLYQQLSEQENDVVERPDATKLSGVNGTLELSGVSFTYADQNKSAVKKTNLVIPAGTSCALVGPSGAGKSTLIKLLNRTIDPTHGAVLLDGTDIRTYTLQSLRSNIGVVTQDSYLFHDTILNNVLFVRPKATLKEVTEACKKAQAHTFISKLPKGYNSVVGERGVKLSGGERQRIALARIFLADPPILILDESTSALDSETEKLVQESLQEVMKGRTTVLIAHRLSTIYLADQIAVMEKGRIVDTGPHAELLQHKGLYNRLWSLQSGGYIQ